MPKLKKKLTGNFTIINNTVLRDKRMGCTERGAYVTLVSMADDWNFSIYMTMEELDEIVQMIVRAICSRRKTERICGQEFPREVIKSAMLKIDRICL